MKYRQAMDSTLDVLTFLAYAAMVGLCIGTLLGGIALVLSAPAHAADEATAKLLLRQAAGEAAAAPLVSTDTVFHSDGPIQRVRVTQAFRNPLEQRQEGLYLLRLPSDATLERLTVSVRAAHGDHDPAQSEEELLPEPSLAVLSAEEAGVVTRSIAGIEPGEMVLVELEYVQVTRYDRGKAGLRLLTQTPRPLAAVRRRRAPSGRTEAVPLGVESAWVDSGGERGAPWLWLLPVVLLYVAVAFLS
jgi:hypothetical protein